MIPLALDHDRLQRTVALATADACQKFLANQRFGAARTAYGVLVSACVALDHDAVIALVAQLGIADPAAAVLVQAWAQAHRIVHPVLEFQTAYVGGDDAGRLLNYRRRGKSAWGDLVAIHDDGQERSPTRIWYQVKPNNPLLLRRQTRNELKLRLGVAQPVKLAVRYSQRDFLAQWGAKFGPLIAQKLHLSLEAFWRAVQHGDAELLRRLGRRPSRRREALRRQGRAVAPAAWSHPQGELFPPVLLEAG